MRQVLWRLVLRRHWDRVVPWLIWHKMGLIRKGVWLIKKSDEIGNNNDNSTHVVPRSTLADALEAASEAASEEVAEAS